MRLGVHGELGFYCLSFPLLLLIFSFMEPCMIDPILYVSYIFLAFPLVEHVCFWNLGFGRNGYQCLGCRRQVSAYIICLVSAICFYTHRLVGGEFLCPGTTAWLFPFCLEVRFTVVLAVPFTLFFMPRWSLVSSSLGPSALSSLFTGWYISALGLTLYE